MNGGISDNDHDESAVVLCSLLGSFCRRLLEPVSLLSPPASTLTHHGAGAPMLPPTSEDPAGVVEARALALKYAQQWVAAART